MRFSLVLISLLACAYAQQGDGEGNEGGGDSGGESSSDIDSGSSTDTLSSTTLIDKPSTTYTATATSIAVTSASSSIPTQTYVPLPQPDKNIDENPDESPEELPEMPLTIKITPAFGVLGVILIISAIPLAVLGSTSRWTGVCIPVSYGSMIALMCILLSTVVMPKLHSNNPERATEALEGEILVGCAILGIITAVVSWWFQRYVAYAVCGFAGIALAWWIQCMRDGGTIHSMAGKWIFYIGLGTVSLVSCPREHFSLSIATGRRSCVVPSAHHEALAPLLHLVDRLVGIYTGYRLLREERAEGVLRVQPGVQHALSANKVSVQVERGCRHD